MIDPAIRTLLAKAEADAAMIAAGIRATVAPNSDSELTRRWIRRFEAARALDGADGVATLLGQRDHGSGRDCGR